MIEYPMYIKKNWCVLLISLSIGIIPLAHATDSNLMDSSVLSTYLQSGMNAVYERNLFWNYSEILAPTTAYDTTTDWFEIYIEPGLGYHTRWNASFTHYGKFSAVLSRTIGIDAYDTGNTGKTTVEEAYVGLQTTDQQAHTKYDISLGAREYKAGTGMLIANGGSNGFSRGALKLGPRKAWELAAIFRASIGTLTHEIFYLDANELPDNDSGNKIFGGNIRYDISQQQLLGITIARVTESRAPYPQAAPGGIGMPIILDSARESLSFVNLYTRYYPFPKINKQLWISSDVAYQRNSNINMRARGGRLQVGYEFINELWKPELSYSYQTFSGDKTSTSNKLERFDPLFYEGSPSAWSTGSKSSMVFINSNVNAHLVALRLSPTTRGTLTLRYAHINANELLSPIQFGQATRLGFAEGVPSLITGVTNKHLADDFFLEYIHAHNQNTYITAGISVSVPGAGSDSIVNKKAPTWAGGFINVVINY